MSKKQQELEEEKGEVEVEVKDNIGEKGCLYEFNEDNINRIKRLYSNEMKDDQNNPIKICMKLIFQSAIEKDTEKRKQLSYELSEFITKPGGLMKMFLAMIDFDTSSQKVTTHTQRFLAVSNIVTSLPKICMPYEDYCKNISRQLKSLLYSENSTYSSIGCIIVKSMLDSQKTKACDLEASLLDHIRIPLRDPLQDNTIHMKPFQSIIATHNLIQNHVPIKYFVDLFPYLLLSLVTLEDTKSRLKSYLKSSLVSVLNGIKPGAACCLIESSLASKSEVPIYEKSFDEDDVSIRLTDQTLALSSQLDNHVADNVLISLLQICDNESLVLEFFFYFKELMWTSYDERLSHRCASILEPLLRSTLEEKPEKLDLLTIILRNHTRSIELIIRTLSGYQCYLRSKIDEKTPLKLINQSIESCLDILEILIVATNDDNGKESLTNSLPVLNMILSLMRQIPCDSPAKNNKVIDEQLPSLIEKIEAFGNIDECFRDSDKFSGSEYDSLVKDLNDKLVPVRVHALVRFRQLIMANQAFFVERIPRLFVMIEGCLADQEPYVFLTCINLMAEMAVRNTQELLPKLVDLHSRQDLDLQHRINIGEVLVRLTKQLHQTTPFYAQNVIPMLLNGCRDYEELMRLSSLINIGELCHNLGDSLGKYIIEILACVEKLIDTDSIQVKCAAIDLLRTALSGLDVLRVESVQTEIGRIYNMLKKAKLTTLDDNLSLQADLALDEINRIAREMLGLDIERNKQITLVKNIKLLTRDV